MAARGRRPSRVTPLPARVLKEAPHGDDSLQRLLDVARYHLALFQVDLGEPDLHRLALDHADGMRRRRARVQNWLADDLDFLLRPAR